MRSALIGYTGFVGSNLAEQKNFDVLYNSRNIADIQGKNYDLIVSAGTSSLVWKANLEPDSDWQSIQKLITSLQAIKTNHFILISSIFAYPNPYNVNEDTPIDEKELTQPYGKHRFKLETFVKSSFKKYTIIRLPNLFGPHLKKNFIFDLIHNKHLELTHKDSKLQWYNTRHLWADITTAIKNNISLINFATEPITAFEIAKHTMDINFTNKTVKPPLNHNMLTKHAKLYGSSSNYIYEKEKILTNLKDYAQEKKGYEYINFKHCME